jgi:hypothetical protein
MRKGILGDKGSIHIHFGKPIGDDIARLPDDLHKTELIKQIGDLIDRHIIGNYKIHKSNRIAYDLIHNITSDDNSGYSNEDRKDFSEDMERKIAELAGEEPELKTIFLEMYARPYQNQLELADLNNQGD